MLPQRNSKQALHCVAWILVLAATVGRANSAAPDDSPVIGLSELSRLDLLPRFKASVKVASISSYDRTGGNDDGFSGRYSFVRKEGDLSFR